MKNTNTLAAKALGAVAFAKGMKCAPVLDGAMMQTLIGREVGDARNAPEMKAWIAGWTQANIAAI